MEWKSTVTITRQEAINLIASRLMFCHTMTDTELADTIEALGFGDNTDLPYYGHNFIVQDGTNKTD